MSDRLLWIYHRLPAPVQSLAASARGYYLRSWRYGPETDRLVEEALEREAWSAERWSAWQEERLAFVLSRAATQVPYYREQWAERRRRGDRSSPEELRNWPVLQKETLRENPRAFLAEDCDPQRMFRENTSGTTGKPLELWLSRETVRQWFAVYEARTRRWHGHSRKENWAILGGQPVVPADRQRPPFWVWNAPMRQLYLSANHLSRKNVPAYIHALDRYRVTHMLVYSSSAAVLAREALDLGLRPKLLRTIVTNAEPLFPWQRETLRAGLGAEVRETYGMAEIVTAAGECPSGTLHLWPEVGRLEILEEEEDAPMPPGETGRLVCTGLLNADMPLVRYAVGDRGALPAEESGCPCGRRLPVVSRIEGRTNDLLVTRDGRRIYWVNPVFYGMPVREAQIVQETLDRVRVRCVPSPGFSASSARTIRERLVSRMGAVEVLLEEVEAIPRGANGKFRAVVCNVPAEEREGIREPALAGRPQEGRS